MQFALKYVLIPVIGIYILPALCFKSVIKQNIGIKSQLAQSKYPPTYENVRKKRSPQGDFMGTIQEMGTNVAGMIMGTANEGFLVKDGRESSVNFFGTKVLTDYNVKAGHGDALNDDNDSDDSDDDEKRRKKRSPCGKKRTTPAVATENAEAADAPVDDNNAEESRRRRNRKGKIKENSFSKNSEYRRKREASPNESENDLKSLEKETEAKLGVIKKISETVQQMCLSIADMFKKIGQKMSGKSDPAEAQQA